MGLTPITEMEFRKKLKGSGIKYYSKIPKKELRTAWFLLNPQTTKKH